jgi:KDO2-lipid IV(A) lauroyltransferase
MKKKIMKIFYSLRDFLIYVFFLCLSVPFRLLPYPQALKLGTLVVRTLFPLFPKYRRIALENISHAFPELNSREHQQILDEHLHHLGYLIADTFWKSRMNQRWFTRYVRYAPGAEETERRLIDQARRKSGFILITGHLGTWEDIAQFVGYRMNGAIVYKTIRNRFLDNWFRKHRSRLGTGVFTMEETPLLVKYLKQGGVIALASDQNAGTSGIFIDFLNRPASTYKGPATIAYLTGAPMIFISLIHRGDGTVILDFEDLGTLKKEDFSSKEEAIRVGTERWVRTLEKFIRKTPGQYFWVHRRWKTTPAMLESTKSHLKNGV